MTNQADPGPWHRILDPERDGPKLPTDEYCVNDKWFFSDNGIDAFSDCLTYRRRKWINIDDIPADAPDDTRLWTPKGWMTTVGQLRFSSVSAVMLRLGGETEPPEPYRSTEEPMETNQPEPELPEFDVDEMISTSELSNDPEGLKKKLASAVNFHGWDNRCNVPDYILAKFLHRTLLTVSMMNRETRQHNGEETSPPPPQPEPPESYQPTEEPMGTQQPEPSEGWEIIPRSVIEDPNALCQKGEQYWHRHSKEWRDVSCPGSCYSRGDIYQRPTSQPPPQSEQPKQQSENPKCLDCGSENIEVSGPDHQPIYCKTCNGSNVKFPDVKPQPEQPKRKRREWWIRPTGTPADLAYSDPKIAEDYEKANMPCVPVKEILPSDPDPDEQADEKFCSSRRDADPGNCRG